MRLIAVLFAFAAVSACATSAPAQALTAPDAIASCLTGAEPDARRACIGIVSGPCMDEPGGETTVGMINCYARERDLWIASVEELTTQLRARESATQLAQLDAMLAANAQWMQASCSYSASLYEGGSLARVVAAACVRNTTAELALDLVARSDEG